MKKIISTILVLGLILCMLPVLPVGMTASAATLSEEDFASKITSLKSTYKDGQYWNGYNDCGYEGTGTKKCSCSPACSPSCSCKCGKFYLNGSYYGGQCFGFANKMGYLVFGSVPTASWTRTNSVSSYYAGDYVRVRNDKHSIFITKVNGDTITYVDCNNAGPCMVKWDRTITAANLKSITTYVYHYSGNTLKGTGNSGGSVPPTVTMVKDNNYPVPVTAYPAITSGKITVYDMNLNAYDLSARNIAYNDECVIDAFYTNGYCSVTYPISGGGTAWAYAKTSDFIPNGVTPYSWSPSQNLTAYTRSNMSTTFGSVFTSDSCKAVGASGSNLQVIYPLTSGGYKMGWVNSSYKPVTPETPRTPTVVPGPVASGILNGKTVVVVAPRKISFAEKVYISEGDICRLHDFNTSTGYCTVDYPGGGKSDIFDADIVRTETVAISEFIAYNPSAQCETATMPDTLHVYPTSSMNDTVGTYTANWSLDPGDEYTTMNQESGKTEVLYYCSRGKHAGYWKLGWCWLDYYSLDINGYLDNTIRDGLYSYGTADIYVNGILRADDVNDFYSANGTYPKGSTYSIQDVKAYKGYTYNGVHSGSTSGTLNGNVTTELNFTKNPVTCSSISVTSKPSKTTYLEGESLNTSGLVIMANYSDGSNANVTSSCTLSGYSNTPGTKTVTVSYSGKSTAFSVYVKSKTPTSLSVTSKPSKITYNIGDAIDLTGLSVKATYDNGTTATVQDYQVLADDDVTSTAGTKTIIVLYIYNEKDVSASFTVDVVAHTYTVTYNANGGSGAPASQTKTENTTLTLKSEKPTKTYTITYNVNGGNALSSSTKSVSATFNNWKASNGNTYNPGGSYTANEATTLTAQWTNPTAGTLATPTKTGSTFDGWYTAASGGTKITSSSTISANTTLYAHWTSSTYTISYNANGGTGAPGNQSKTHGTTLKLSSSVPTKSYTITYAPNGGSVSTSGKTVSATFNNWKASNGTTYDAGASYTANEATTMTAQWTNPTAGTLATPTKSGSSFDGWYTAADGGAKVTSTTEIKANTTIYAHWSVKTDATIAVGNVTGAVGKTVSLPITVSKNPGITAVGVTITYDSTVLKLVGAENGIVMPKNTFTPGGKYESPFMMIWNDDIDDYSDDDTLAILKFEILKGENGDKSDVGLTVMGDSYTYNADLLGVPFNAVNGSVTIMNRFPGDVNDDGAVTTMDATLIKRYIVGGYSIPTFIEANADVNGDGEITTMDATLIKRYIVGGYGVELV